LARPSRRVLSLAASVLAAGGVAAAQPYTQTPYTQAPYTQTPYGTPSVVTAPGAPVPYSSLLPNTPTPAGDGQNVMAALAAAKQGDGPRVRAAMSQILDPTARQIALWALIDGAPTEVTFSEAEAARRQLAGWPREIKRKDAAEALLPSSGLAPSQVIAWFAGGKPHTGGGALALAIALNASGRPGEAATTIREAWRTLIFDQSAQNAILASFNAVLTPDDHATRVDMLLYGAHDAQAMDLMRYLSADQQALAQARMALHRGDSGAESLIAALPPALQNAPGIIFERMIRLRDGGMDVAARQLAPGLPQVLPDQTAAERLWKHGALAIDALKEGDANGAYAVAAHSGLTAGPNAAEAHFLAGWLALTRLHDPRMADTHFAAVADAGGSPLTQSRAYYWRGRAADAEGDPVAAQLFYGQAAAYNTTFYGQLAAERAGQKTLTLGRDPEIGSAERAAFEASGPVKALRYLAGIGDRDAFKVFAAELADILPTAADEAQLIDLTRTYGDPTAAMRVVRNAAKHGFIMPERGYPLTTVPTAVDGAEAALVLGITRQESSFDPSARSGSGARGMMQLMPGTAEGLARKLGMDYSSYDLDDPLYNMRLGSTYLGQLVGQFSGSYVMATAAYNAGPGRPNQWTAACGDPRSGGSDPLNYIECIPFSETRDYVMRVLEATQVYRARLHGGVAPLTLESDLKRGGYGYP